VQTSTPQFILMCQLLVQAIEEVSEERRDQERERILDTFMAGLMREGLVFDRAYGGLLFDQWQADPDAAAAPLSEARVEALRDQVRRQDYVTDAMLKTMGERLLWVLGSS
jgi:hypothetical protein